MYSLWKWKLKIDGGSLRNLFPVNLFSSFFIMSLILGMSFLVPGEIRNEEEVLNDISVSALIPSKTENDVNADALIPREIQIDTRQGDEKPVVCEDKVIPALPNKADQVYAEYKTLFRRVNKAERLFHPIIIEAASRYKIDPALVKAIILAESEYNPRAISNKGAIGLMQLMPMTAQEVGVEDIFNPEHNINGGVKYFKRLLDRYDGDVKLALAAYNAGSKKVRRYKGVPPFKETKYYIKKVFSYYEYYKENMTGEMGRA